LDTFIDPLLSVAPEVIASKITFFKSAIWCDFSGQTSFIQCHPYNNANMMKFTCGKQLVFRALLENIVDDLNGIYYAGLD
jgi:hypothetical protein